MAFKPKTARIISGADQGKVATAYAPTPDQIREHGVENIIQYDENRHKGHLGCSEPGCSAKVHFRREHTPHGGSATAKATFKTNPGSDHKLGCPFPSNTEDLNPNQISLEDALDHNHIILINMNGETGHSLRGAFGSTEHVRTLSSTYNDLRRKPHATVAIHDQNELTQVVGRINGAPRGKIFVAHVQQVRNLDHVLIDDDNEKMGKLVNAMALQLGYSDITGEENIRADGSIRKTQHIGFPRRISGSLTKTTADALRKNPDNRRTNVNMASNHIGEFAGQPLIVLNRLQFASRVPRQDVLKHTSYSIFATPTLSEQAIRRAMESCRKGEPGYIIMDWQVNSADQIAPAPDAQLLKPQATFGWEDEPAPTPTPLETVS